MSLMVYDPRARYLTGMLGWPSYDPRRRYLTGYDPRARYLYGYKPARSLGDSNPFEVGLNPGGTQPADDSLPGSAWPGGVNSTSASTTPPVVVTPASGAPQPAPVFTSSFFGGSTAGLLAAVIAGVAIFGSGGKRR